MPTGRLPPRRASGRWEELAQALSFIDWPGRAIVRLERAVASWPTWRAATPEPAAAGLATRLRRNPTGKVEALASPRARV